MPVSISTRLLGDFDLNGHVNAADVTAALTALSDLNIYRTSKSMSIDDLLNIGDIDSSGNVTNADLQGLLDYLKAGFGNVAPVPEPASIVLLALTLPGLAFAVMRRRGS